MKRFYLILLFLINLSINVHGSGLGNPCWSVWGAWQRQTDPTLSINASIGKTVYSMGETVSASATTSWTHGRKIKFDTAGCEEAQEANWIVTDNSIEYTHCCGSGSGSLASFTALSATPSCEIKFTLTCKTTDPSQTFTKDDTVSCEIVEVASITASDVTICKGGTVNLTATTYPSGHLGLIRWTASVGSFNPSSGGSTTWTPPADYVSSSDGDVTITATCGGYSASGKSLTITVINVESVDICKPDASSWDDLPWEQVVLEGDDLKLKVKIAPGVTSLSDFIDACSPEAEIRTFTVASDGTETDVDTATVTITTANSSLEGDDEVRVTIPAADIISLDLVEKNEDSTAEKCSADNQSVTTGPSHRRDSDGFDSNAPGTQRGLARGGGDITTTPPEGGFTKSFIQAAGVLCIHVTLGGTTCEKRQIQEQADIFYYSGHGGHDSARLNSIVGPADVQPYWDDIDKCIIAGCSVLDINNYNNNPDIDSAASPGEQWVTTGPDYFYGYNWKAPLDDNVGDPDFTKDIIEGYLASSDPLELHKWMNANKAKSTTSDRSNPGQRPWNACFLHKTGGAWRYWWFDYNTLVGGEPQLQFKDEADW